MCNNYNLLTNAEAMIQLGFLWEKANRNVPPLSVYPDYVAPIVREMEPGRRTIALARWGLPSLKDAPTDKPNKGATNIRHPWFDDWKGYLGVEHQCLVPFDSLAEPTKLEDGKSGLVRVEQGHAPRLSRRAMDGVARRAAQGRGTA